MWRGRRRTKGHSRGLILFPNHVWAYTSNGEGDVARDGRPSRNAVARCSILEH